MIRRLGNEKTCPRDTEWKAEWKSSVAEAFLNFSSVTIGEDTPLSLAECAA